MLSGEVLKRLCACAHQFSPHWSGTLSLECSLAVVCRMLATHRCASRRTDRLVSLGFGCRFVSSVSSGEKTVVQVTPTMTFYLLFYFQATLPAFILAYLLASILKYLLTSYLVIWHSICYFAAFYLACLLRIPLAFFLACLSDILAHLTVFLPAFYLSNIFFARFH